MFIKELNQYRIWDQKFAGPAEIKNKESLDDFKRNRKMETH